MVPEDAVRGGGAIPEFPCQAQMPGVLSQCWWRNGKHRAAGMGQAVAVHLPGAGDPGEHATAAGADD